jgi:prepilin-type N-terminal cleavage/methylation domain-containing protein
MAARRKGFTLIEVLVTVVLVSTMAAIAIPRYMGSKDRAYAAAMKADLHIAALYEEQYAAENHGQYFGGSASSGSPLNGFSPSKDVTVTFTAFNILGSQLADWTAVARNGMSTESCQMRTGVVTCTTDVGLATGVLHGN